MNKKPVSPILREILLVLGSLFLIVFMCRLWPLLLLMIIGVFVALIVLLFKQTNNKPEVIVPMPIKTQPPEIKVPTQKDVFALAYSVILRQITAIVTDKYPNARWIWEAPNAKERIEKGDELFILLNRAGGYNRAKVVITNLQVTDVLFGASSVETDEPTDSEDNEEEPMEENYELLAFEWVESHIVELNARVNEAIGKGKSELLLKSDELPTKESWDDIRFELEKENIADTKCIPAGILIKLKR